MIQTAIRMISDYGAHNKDNRECLISSAVARGLTPLKIRNYLDHSFGRARVGKVTGHSHENSPYTEKRYHNDRVHQQE